MNDIVLAPYSERERATWDDVVQESRNGTFLHTRGFIEYHAHRFDEQSVIVHVRGRAVAVFPCTRDGQQIVSHGGLSFGGLVSGYELKAALTVDVVAAIKTYYRALGADRLVYKAIPHIFHRYPAEEDLYALVVHGAKLVRRDISSAVVLADRPALSTLRARGVRLAKRAGLECREGAFHSEFVVLLTEVLKKYGRTPVHSVEEILYLQSIFPDKIRLFGVFLEGRLLAGTLIFLYGPVAHTQYLACSEEGRTLGALDLLLANLLDGALVPARTVNFGISTEQNGHHLNRGLAFQKEGFGGRGVVYDHYELVL